MWYKDDAIYTDIEIRIQHPNISFPVIFDPTFLGYEIVLDTAPPVVLETQIAYQNGTEVIDDNRVIKWSIRDKTEEELEASKPIVPNSITMSQCRRQLLRLGFLEGIDTYIKTQGGEAAIAWEYEINVLRDNPLVLGIMAMLEWTEEQLDEYFLAASKL